MKRLKEWFVARTKIKKILLGAGIILIVAFLGFRIFSSKNNQSSYQTAQVNRGTLIQATTASGTVLSANYMDISSQASGIVQNIYVKDGDVVKSGDKIADIQLDQSGVKNQTQAWSNYLLAKSNLDSAQSTQIALQSEMFSKWKTYMDLAQNSTYQNSDNTPNDTNRTLPEFHIAQDDWLSAEAKYKNQQTVISQTQAALSNAWTNYQLASATITAPQDGTISNITIVPGMQLTSNNSNANSSTTNSSSSNSTSNSNSAQRIAVIQNTGKPLITLNLSEVDIPTIKIGQKATITFDSLKDKTFTGEVAAIDKIGSTSNGVTTYPVTIQLDTDSTDILPNMSASANIILQTKDNILKVPTTAIQTASDGTSYVRVLQNGKITQVTVEVGIASDTETEITSGLSENDTVITSISTANSSTTNSSQTRSPFSGLGGGFGGGARGR